MAKQIFERKQVVKLVGRLDKDDDGKFVVTVEDKDRVTEYDLDDILNNVLGSVISLQSEEDI